MLSVYEAYDGAPFAESVSSGNVKFLDLSVPQFGIPIYDWIINLEVAEAAFVVRSCHFLIQPNNTIFINFLTVQDVYKNA